MTLINQNDNHIYSEYSQFTLMDTANNLSILRMFLNFLKDYYVLKRDNSKPNETVSLKIIRLLQIMMFQCCVNNRGPQVPLLSELCKYTTTNPPF